ncbi:conserved hypothetical protein [Ricinus communis]|uniref:Uncharacterized protein n=1 Tax=Ricinus communis TaxID=3988 RepID=B9RX99_RICCO|nr:conserved hypothetical protein [Ricinus communis]
MSRWYHKSIYLSSWQFPIQLVPGRKFTKCDEFEPIEPPPIVKMVPPTGNTEIQVQIRPAITPTQPYSKILSYILYCIWLSNLQLGMQSETVIDEGSSTTFDNPDAQTKYPIPNERNLSRKKPFKPASNITRDITFHGEGTEVRILTNLPFQPLRL